MSGAFKPPSFSLAVANGAVIGLGRACFVGIRALFIFLLVPLIGIDTYGHYMLAQSWYLLILPLSLWGAGELSIRGYLRCPPDRQAAFLGTGLALRIVLGGGAMLAIIAAARMLEPLPELRALIYIYATATLTRGMGSWLGSLFTALGVSASWVRLSITFTVLEVTLVLLAAGAGAGLTSIALMQASLWALSTLVAYAYFSVRFVVIKPAWDRVLAKHFLSDGARVGFATFLLLSIVPGLLLVYRQFNPVPEALGAVALVLQLFLLAQQVLMVVLNAVLAALGADRELEADGARVFFTGSLPVVACAGGAIALAVSAVSDALVTAFSESVFSPALRLLAAFSWVFVPILLVQCCRVVIIARGAFPVYLRAVLAGALVSPLCLVVISQLGELSERSVLAAMGLGLALMSMLLGRYCFSASSLVDDSHAGVFASAVVLVILAGCYLAQPGTAVLLVVVVAFSAGAWRASAALLSQMRLLQPSRG